MNSGEAAESVVRMSLQGTEVALKVTGEAAKNVAALLYAIYKGRKKTKGKIKLAKMLKSGKPLKIFSIREDELKFFQKIAKKYGLLYALLIDKYNKDMDGMIDIAVPASAASRLNRIINRYKFSTVKEESDIQHSKGSPHNKVKKNKKSKDDEIVDDLLKKPTERKSKTEDEVIEDLFASSKDNKENNNLKKNDQSKTFLKNKKDLETGTKEKPSVRAKLKNIKESMKNNKGINPKRENNKNKGNNVR